MAKSVERKRIARRTQAVPGNTENATGAAMPATASGRPKTHGEPPRWRSGIEKITPPRQTPPFHAFHRRGKGVVSTHRVHPDYARGNFSRVPCHGRYSM